MTSGYNSDAVSDHEYENIQVVSCREPEVGKLQQNSHSLSGAKEEGAHETVDGEKAEEQQEEEEEDNYVILRAVTENPDSGHWVSCLGYLFIFLFVCQCGRSPEMFLHCTLTAFEMLWFNSIAFLRLFS